jgi:hypothetical protein
MADAERSRPGGSWACTCAKVCPINAAYNARRQRVLEAKTPDQVVAERLTAKPALAKHKPAGRAGPCDITKARLIAENAKEVSQPDS